VTDVAAKLPMRHMIVKSSSRCKIFSSSNLPGFGTVDDRCLGILSFVIFASRDAHARLRKISLQDSLRPQRIMVVRQFTFPVISLLPVFWLSIVPGNIDASAAEPEFKLTKHLIDDTIEEGDGQSLADVNGDDTNNIILLKPDDPTHPWERVTIDDSFPTLHVSSGNLTGQGSENDIVAGASHDSRHSGLFIYYNASENWKRSEVESGGDWWGTYAFGINGNGRVSEFFVGSDPDGVFGLRRRNECKWAQAIVASVTEHLFPRLRRRPMNACEDGM